MSRKEDKEKAEVKKFNNCNREHISELSPMELYNLVSDFAVIRYFLEVSGDKKKIPKIKSVIF